MIDQFAQFARELPAWCGQDGYPKSWRHFQYGMQHIHRAHALEELRMTNAVRLAQSIEADDFAKYHSTLRTASGLTRL